MGLAFVSPTPFQPNPLFGSLLPTDPIFSEGVFTDGWTAGLGGFGPAPLLPPAYQSEGVTPYFEDVSNLTAYFTPGMPYNLTENFFLLPQAVQALLWNFRLNVDLYFTVESIFLMAMMMCLLTQFASACLFTPEATIPSAEDESLTIRDSSYSSSIV
jgi:hypothetical protein